MSGLLVLASLLLHSGFAAAQISAPSCTLSALYDWSFNSMNQNPCTVAAYLLGTCNEGSFIIHPLLPGYSYMGPSALDAGNWCKCNTVAYSLLSACAACQGELWPFWSDFSTNCSRVLPASSFPHPVPSGTRVPHWALIDVTVENSWSSSESLSTGGTPELSPGAAIGNSGISSSTTPGTALPTSFSPPSSFTSSKSRLNIGAIVGGAVAGVAVIAIAALAFFYLRQRRGSPQAASAASAINSASQPRMGEVQQPMSDSGSFTPSSMPASFSTTTRLYDPNSQATFPEYQGVPPVPEIPAHAYPAEYQGASPVSEVHAHAYPAEYQGAPLLMPEAPSQVRIPSYDGSGNIVANMRTSLPQQPQGYHGLPMV
ncbi:hypothetical protein BC826DRAFT_165512 [Russula brevipes]|nr:hypothetical protein BC826DRAFT_165512 [Russula brevipes]